MKRGRRLLQTLLVLAACAAGPAWTQSPVPPSEPPAAARAADAEAPASQPPVADKAAPDNAAPDKAPDEKPAKSEWIDCGAMWKWVEYQCTGLKDAWRNGGPILYVTGFTYHDRATYSQEQLDSYNERAWGGGFGWGRFNDEGDHFGWYGLVFRDSHFQYTKMVGWSAMTYWPKQSDYSVGLGYTIFLGSRPDIYNSIPFPGILPLASVRLSKLEILGTYIPKVSAGTTGNGNVGFVFGRWLF
jgi:palmitoyl transferase